MLPKKRRIESGFSHILQEGQRKKSRYCIVVGLKNDLGYARFGIIVTKKVGNAVVRNKVKRIFRSIIRENILKIERNYDFVILASPFVTDWRKMPEITSNLIHTMQSL